MNDTTQPTALSFAVDGMSCDHCRIAISGEVGQVAGVDAVVVDLDAKRVQVSGSNLDTGAIVDAIDEAGYDAVAS